MPAAFDNNYQSIMRDIDWHRGSPYIWRISDYDELMKSEFLFARKFDEDVDSQIIDLIVSTLSQ